MILTLGQAAKAANVSKSTLSRAIKEGRMSAERKDDGAYMIDTSELFRVYPAPTSATDCETVAQNSGMPLSEHNNNGLLKEVEVLRERLRDKDRHIETLENQVEDVQKDRDHWRSHAERSTLLLEDLRQKDEVKRMAEEAMPKKKRWFW
jgi:hypothetical protein